MAGLLSWRRDRSASLFERIQAQDDGLNRYSRNAELLTSIKHNLNRVLNSHPGGSKSSPLLGVIDLNDATATATDFRKAIEEAIRECILNYEPRISRVAVSTGNSEGDDPLMLRFHILAQVSFDDIDDVIEFNIQLDNHQRYHLSE
ncbi:type VI secretion system baseplate subunit TssE [Enterobacteriaceae bacterium 4M9]|nr:type VI secretion system baseplate subunit TssE [Enterobacteriaceae bacterium 4M9]